MQASLSKWHHLASSPSGQPWKRLVRARCAQLKVSSSPYLSADARRSARGAGSSDAGGGGRSSFYTAGNPRFRGAAVDPDPPEAFYSGPGGNLAPPAPFPSGARSCTFYSTNASVAARQG